MPPPPTHFSACWNWAKLGRGLIHEIVTFPPDNHYRSSNVIRVRNLCTFSGCLKAKNDEVRHTCIIIYRGGGTGTASTAIVKQVGLSRTKTGVEIAAKQYCYRVM